MGFTRYARAIANSWLGKISHDREELTDAATFGLTLAIEAVKNDPAEWNPEEGFNKVLNRFVMRQVNAVKGANPYTTSLDAPLVPDEESGSLYSMLGEEELDEAVCKTLAAQA